MRWSYEDFPMTIAVVTIVFGMISLIVVTIYSVVNWGQVGYTGPPGIVGLVGPKGDFGPDVATIVRACFKEITSTGQFITPVVDSGEFNTTDTFWFDSTIIGTGIAGNAVISVTIVNDNEDLTFINSNEVKVTLETNKINAVTFRVYKGVSANVLNLAIIDESGEVNSTITDVSTAPSVIGADIKKSLGLRFSCTSQFKIIGRILKIPSKRGFTEVSAREYRREMF